MNRKFNSFFASLIVVAVAGCSDVAEQESAQQPAGVATPQAAAPIQKPVLQGALSGKALSVLNSGGYTYVEIDTGKGSVWVAGPVTAVAVGDSVAISDTALMQNFYSKTLNRTFEAIYFAGMLSVNGAAGTAAAPSPYSPKSAAVPAAPDLSVDNIAKAEGGKTVGEIFAQKAELAGQKVIVRGKVVKYNSGIRGKNWIHIQDGTAGPDGAIDLILTSDGTAQLGNVLVGEGTVALDRDFGYGYKYDLLIEDAVVSIE